MNQADNPDIEADLLAPQQAGHQNQQDKPDANIPHIDDLRTACKLLITSNLWWILVISLKILVSITVIIISSLKGVSFDSHHSSYLIVVVLADSLYLAARIIHFKITRDDNSLRNEFNLRTQNGRGWNDFSEDERQYFAQTHVKIRSKSRYIGPLSLAHFAIWGSCLVMALLEEKTAHDWDNLSAVDVLAKIYLLDSMIWLVIVVVGKIVFAVIFRSLKKTGNLDEFTKTYNSKDFSENECIICLLDYEQGDKIVQLKCDHRHYFHEECAKIWCQKKSHCPICNKSVHEEEMNKMSYVLKYSQLMEQVLGSKVL